MKSLDENFRGDTIWKGIFKYQWYSICGIHGTTLESCHMCMAGSYMNMFNHFWGDLFYKVCPRPLWIKWANRPKGKQKFMQRVGKYFPNLK